MVADPDMVPPHPTVHPFRMLTLAADPPDVRTLVAQIRLARFNRGIECVRCRSGDVVRWGTFRERQRYRCNVCRRTFSDLTGTPAAWCKRIDRLIDYRRCMSTSMSLRATARAVGIHLTTSFRWRHRYLGGASLFDHVKMTGLVEVAESWVLCSDTGPRYPKYFRRRQRRTLTNPLGRRSWICCMRDRTGRSITWHAGEWPSGFPEWETALQEVTENPAGIIGSIVPLRHVAIAARALGIPTFRSRAPIRGATGALLLHADEAGRAIHRLRHWLRRFRGVKTKYLCNYIQWHEMLDQHRTTDFRLDRLFSWPLDPFPLPIETLSAPP